MRSEQLEYVAAIVRLGSFRRAAEELHISQPALSSTVRNLERELGVDILERGRSGAQVSDEGRELLPHILTAIDAIDRLRRAADDQHHTSRVLRLATGNAATAQLLMDTLLRFRELHPETHIEVVGAQEAAIEPGLREGRFDLGLVVALVGDDTPPDFETARLLCGRPVVCMRADHPLATLEAISTEELSEQTVIMMRSGYLMHRYVHRLLDGRSHPPSCSTEGAEMAKLMVAEGLGVTLLPDFSVIGDPLERAGIITWRPLEDDSSEVELGLRRRRSLNQPRALRDLYQLLVASADQLSPVLNS